jgi:2-polyprenyl-3-methyl-5-hydroxy-6-metoxy-1,4-benzoquinol methylase
MIVSQQDIEHLKIIRESVRRHIEAASYCDKYTITVLDIAPQVHAGAKEYFKNATVKTLDIEPGADYWADICNDNSGLIPDNTFDLIICTEVLEHVANPFAAVAEINRILKPGGQAYVTTPFNFRIHGPLPDNWRFTIHGLKQLFSHMEVLSIEEETTGERDLMPIHYRLIARKNVND